MRREALRRPGRRPSPLRTIPTATTPARVAEDLEEAEFYFEQGLLDEARGLYERILAAAPNHPQAMLRLGEVAARSGGAAAGAPVAAPARCPAPAPPRRRAHRVAVPEAEVEIDHGATSTPAPGVEPPAFDADRARRSSSSRRSRSLSSRPARAPLPPPRSRLVQAETTAPSLTGAPVVESGDFDLAGDCDRRRRARPAHARGHRGRGLRAGLPCLQERHRARARRRRSRGSLRPGHRLQGDGPARGRHRGLSDRDARAGPAARLPPHAGSLRARARTGRRCRGAPGAGALAAGAAGGPAHAAALRRGPRLRGAGRRGARARGLRRGARRRSGASATSSASWPRSQGPDATAGRAEPSGEAYESFDDLLAESPTPAAAQRYESFDDLFADEPDELPPEDGARAVRARTRAGAAPAQPPRSRRPPAKQPKRRRAAGSGRPAAPRRRRKISFV